MENNLSLVKDTFKELPNNIEAEQAVIGSILVQNETFDEINTIVSSVNFYDPMHQSIFFKQKTAYEIHERLVGSEMCIRDSNKEYEIKKLSTENKELYGSVKPVSYTHLTLPTTPYV